MFHSFEGTLRPTAPFDFSQSLAFLSDFSPTMGEQQLKTNDLIKAVEIKGRTVAFEVRGLSTVENPGLKFMAHSESEFTDEVRKRVTDRITFFLSLDDDLKGFYDIAKKDERFEPVIKRFYGHKQVKFLTPFETACWAVLGQRIPMTVAHKMKERIVQGVGGRIIVKGIEYRSFPEATVLAAVGTERMLEMVPNGRKAEYLTAVAKAFSQVDEQWLRTAPFDEVHEWLTNIKGIGDWSANFIMIRGLGRMEELLSIGPEIAADAAKLYRGKDGPLTDEEVCAIAEKYGRWKGYWAYYLRIYGEFTYVFEKGKKQLRSTE